MLSAETLGRSSIRGSNGASMTVFSDAISIINTSAIHESLEWKLEYRGPIKLRVHDRVEVQKDDPVGHPPPIPLLQRPLNRGLVPPVNSHTQHKIHLVGIPWPQQREPVKFQKHVRLIRRLVSETRLDRDAAAERASVSSSDIRHHLAPTLAAELASISARAETRRGRLRRLESYLRRHARGDGAGRTRREARAGISGKFRAGLGRALTQAQRLGRRDVAGNAPSCAANCLACRRHYVKKKYSTAPPRGGLPTLETALREPEDRVESSKRPASSRGSELVPEISGKCTAG